MRLARFRMMCGDAVMGAAAAAVGAASSRDLRNKMPLPQKNLQHHWKSNSNARSLGDHAWFAPKAFSLQPSVYLPE
jgi:hypothetical protein